MAKKKKGLFDSRGGVVVLCRLLLESPAYASLPAQSKVLITLLQLQWRDDRPVSFGIREAENKIPCSRKLAIESFKALEKHGFITRESEALFNSKSGSKTREWILTWMPFSGKQPQNLWKKYSAKN